MVYLLLIILAVILIIWIYRYPFYGLIFMILVNSVEGLFPLTKGLTIGRFVGIFACIGWVNYLQKNGGIMFRLGKSKLIRSLWAFPMFCLFGVIFGKKPFDNVFFFLTILLLAIMAIMIESLVDNKRKLYLLLLAIAMSSVLISILPFADYFNIDLYSPLGVEHGFGTEGVRAKGLTNSSNSLGLDAAMGLFCVLAIINLKHRMLGNISLLVIALILIGGLLLSGSRTNLIIFIVFLFVFGGFRFAGPKRGFYSSLVKGGCLIAIGFLAYKRIPEELQDRFIFFGKNVQASTLDRAQFADDQRKNALYVFSRHPIFGVGLNGFRVNSHGAHDTVSGLLAETGLLGIFSFIWLVFSCLKKLYRSSIKCKKADLKLYYYSITLMASFIAILVGGWGGYTVYYNRWFWIVVGISSVIERWSLTLHIKQERLSKKMQLRY